MPFDETGDPERRIETVAGMTEVGVGGRGQQTGVDSDEEQFETGTDQIVDRAVPERLEFGSTEGGYGTVSDCGRRERRAGSTGSVRPYGR